MGQYDRGGAGRLQGGPRPGRARARPPGLASVTSQKPALSSTMLIPGQMPK